MKNIVKIKGFGSLSKATTEDASKMTPEKLSEFYGRPSCDEHEQVDELICDAFNLAEEGEALIAAERLIKAREIITGVLLQSNLRNRTKRH